MSQAINESVNRLFSEPFEPRWMRWAREAEEQAEDERLNLCRVKRAKHRRKANDDPIEAAWRQSAYRSIKRISDRFPPKHATLKS